MTPPRRPVGRPSYDLPESVCRHAGRRGRRPLHSTPRTFRGPRPNGIPPFQVCIAGRGLDPSAAACGQAALQSPESVCRHAGRRGRRPLQGAPRTFRRPLPNGIPLFRFALQGGVLTPPRRPVGRPPYDLPAVRAAMRGVGDAAPYKVRRERSAARCLTASPFSGLHCREES